MSALDFTARAMASRALLNGQAAEEIAQQVRDGGSAVLNGAKGDGVSDDQPALQALMAAGGRVHFPKGDYKLGTAINVPSNTHIAMAPGARLLPAAANQTMVMITGAPPISWVALSADVAVGAKALVHASSAYNVGQWIELRSNAPVTSGPNTGIASKISCLRRIVKKAGTGPYTYTLNKPVLDAYKIADAAEIGVPTMVENVTLEGVTVNAENYATQISFGIYMHYCAGIRIIDPTIIGSKAKAGADVVSPDGIRFSNCFDVEVRNPVLKHIGWYGLSIGSSEQIRSYGGHAEDCRHAVSVVYAPYGEPTDVVIDGLTASNCTLSSFDTHDTGRDIVFSNCVSVGAGDDGFQFRTNGVRAIGCTAVHSTVDGFSDNTGVTNTVLIGCKADRNGRAGVNFVGPAELTDCEITNNTNNTVAGVVLQKGGRVTGGRITGNYAALRIFDAPLLVRGIYAPADTVQTVFCTAVSGLGGRYNKVQLRDNEIPGYAINTIFARQVAARPAGDLPPITSGNRLTADIAGAEQNGEVTLVAGTATVSTTAVKRATGANWSEDVISKIELRRVSPGGTVGNLYVESVTHQSGFTVRSTNAADTSKVRWTVEL